MKKKTINITNQRKQLNANYLIIQTNNNTPSHILRPGQYEYMMYTEYFL